MRRSLLHLRGQDKDEISLVQLQLDSAPVRWASCKMFSVYLSNKGISSQIGTRNGPYLSPLDILTLWIKKFGRHMSFYGVTDYPWFGLLVMSPLGFKARLGSFLQHLRRGNTWWMFTEVHLWTDTCWPLNGQHGGQLLFLTCVFQ